MINELRQTRLTDIPVYVFLFCEVLADGLLTNSLINKGLGTEGNGLLAPFAGSLNLLTLKVIGTLAAIFLLWHISRKRPYMALITASIFMIIYMAIIQWNYYWLVSA